MSWAAELTLGSSVGEPRYGARGGRYAAEHQCEHAVKVRVVLPARQCPRTRPRPRRAPYVARVRQPLNQGSRTQQSATNHWRSNKPGGGARRSRGARRRGSQPKPAVSYYFPALDDLLGEALAAVIAAWLDHGETVAAATKGNGITRAATAITAAVLPSGGPDAVRNRYEHLLAAARNPSPPRPWPRCGRGSRRSVARILVSGSRQPPDPRRAARPGRRGHVGRDCRRRRRAARTGADDVAEALRASTPKGLTSLRKSSRRTTGPRSVRRPRYTGPWWRRQRRRAAAAAACRRPGPTRKPWRSTSLGHIACRTRAAPRPGA